jgi:hypothetical protein
MERPLYVAIDAVFETQIHVALRLIVQLQSAPEVASIDNRRP